jgi:hypothetical protein
VDFKDLLIAVVLDITPPDGQGEPLITSCRTNSVQLNPSTLKQRLLNRMAKLFKGRGILPRPLW